MKVLIIEDDLALGESLKEYLEVNGIEAKWISDDRQVNDILLNQQFDVIVLDLILKYQPGESILKDLRNRGMTTPVLILTAKRSLKDKEICFEIGADDYVTKPFAPKELLLRIKALSRRRILEPIIHYKDLTINLNSQTVYRQGRQVKLSSKEWLLLSYLLKHQGQIVSKEGILNYVWGNSCVGDEIIRSYIKRLRQQLPELDIQTHKGRGYQLK